MVKFNTKLYSTEAVTSKVGAIKWKTMCGIGMVGVYFLTLASNDRDIFDIYSATVFKQRALRKSNLEIIGIAGSYHDAVMLTQRMLLECKDKTGNLNAARNYFGKFFR